MSQKMPPFSEADLKAVGQALESAATHAELGGLFRDVDLTESHDIAGVSKWRRIFNVLAEAQGRAGTGNYAMKFIQTALSPRRFVNRPSEHEALREGVNRLLAFHGYHLLPGGKFERIASASTIDEARSRASRLRLELERRSVHPDVLSFCQPELMQENYFHAVLEATKSLSEKIRQKSGLAGDAGELATKAFSLGKSGAPILAFNSLRTETERSEQTGLMNLCVGMFGTFRNTTAHGTKLAWLVTEQDALDLLTMASFLHRRVDAARTVSAV
jgi:uncharacterized protein (TIGR02391 family)